MACKVPMIRFAAPLCEKDKVCVVTAAAKDGVGFTVEQVLAAIQSSLNLRLDGSGIGSSCLFSAPHFYGVDRCNPSPQPLSPQTYTPHLTPYSRDASPHTLNTTS